MEKEFVTYEQALELKELGFDEPCLASWTYKTKERIPTLYGCGALLFNTDGLITNQTEDIICSAPLYQQCWRWFREKKIHSIVQEYDINNYMFSIDDGINRDIEVTGYDSYEEAELECLKQLIKIVKNGKSHSNS
jgi:hypothetical protein